MSRRYEDEQKELAGKIKKLRSEIEKQSSQAMTTDMFISLVRRYTRARKLTPRMLNELVEKIEVYNAEKIDGVWEQRLRIHYNCVGKITIPKMLPLPIPDVTVNTRKGVFVNYAQQRSPDKNKKDECSYSFSNAIRTLVMSNPTIVAAYGGVHQYTEKPQAYNCQRPAFTLQFACHL